MNFGILILVLNTEREIAVEEKIRLFNSIITGDPLYLTGTEINEGRN